MALVGEMIVKNESFTYISENHQGLQLNFNSEVIRGTCQSVTSVQKTVI